MHADNERAPITASSTYVPPQSGPAFELPPMQTGPASLPSLNTTRATYPVHESRGSPSVPVNSYLPPMHSPRPTAALPYSNMRDSPVESRDSESPIATSEANTEWKKAATPLLNRLMNERHDVRAADASVQELFSTVSSPDSRSIDVNTLTQEHDLHPAD